MKKQELSNRARSQIKARDMKGLQETVKQINARTERKKQLMEEGRLR